METIETLGKYEIKRTLGRGAMGIVYEGWDPAIARRVAIKTVRIPEAEDAETEEQLARFRREAQAAGRLTHPNIVGVFDYGETNDIAYIVMEYVDGPSVKSLLDKQERFALPNVMRVMEDLLAGLQFSHERGVVHRDIKPANVMLTSAGQAKIADFGIARIESSSMTQAGTVLGTPAYMSPEQFMGQVVDKRSDIYSSGVLLYQLLTGERPFDGGLSAIMHKALNTEPPAPSHLAVTCPPAFDRVVRKAMAKRPEERFQSASEFAQALRAAASGGGAEELETPAEEATIVASAGTVGRPPSTSATPAGPASGVPTEPARTRRPPALAMIVAAVLLVVLAAGGGVWVFLTRGAGPARTTESVPAAAAQAGQPNPSPPAAAQSRSSGASPAAPHAAPQAAQTATAAAHGSTSGASSGGSAAQPAAAVPPSTPGQAAAPPSGAGQAAAPPGPSTAPQPSAPPRTAVSPAQQAPEQATGQATGPGTEQSPASSQPTAAEQAAIPTASPTRQAAAEPAPTPGVTAGARQPSVPAAASTRPAAAEPAASPGTASGAAQMPAPAATQGKRAATQPSAASGTPAAAAPPPTTAATVTPEGGAGQQMAATSLQAVRHELQQILAGQSCATLTGTVQDSGTIALTGIAGRTAADAVRQALAGRALNWQVKSVDPYYCGALEVVHPIADTGGPPGSQVRMNLTGGITRLHDGQRILPEIVMPDFRGYLRVDYVAHDGGVMHLYPQVADPAQHVIADPSHRFASGATVTLGKASPGHPVWEVGEPYGTDMIIAVVSSEPLFADPRPNNVESKGAYLRALKNAVDTARERGDRVVGTALTVDTLPKR